MISIYEWLKEGISNKKRLENERKRKKEIQKAAEEIRRTGAVIPGSYKPLDANYAWGERKVDLRDAPLFSDEICDDDFVPTITIMPHAYDRMRERDAVVYNKEVLEKQVKDLLNEDRIKCLIANTYDATYDGSTNYSRVSNQSGSTDLFGIRTQERDTEDEINIALVVHRTEIGGISDWEFVVKTVYVGRPPKREGQPFAFYDDHRVINVPRKHVNSWRPKESQRSAIMTFESFSSLMGF